MACVWEQSAVAHDDGSSIPIHDPSVGPAVGDAVGDALGVDDGNAVGADVGAVGDDVGVKDGAALGDAVGGAVPHTPHKAGQDADVPPQLDRPRQNRGSGTLPKHS